MKYPETIENLIECYQKLPGIGAKTAERMAMATLKWDSEMISFFSNNLLDIESKIRKCVCCNNISDDDLCYICKDDNRDKKKICIIEDVRKIITIEKLKIFDGMYYLIEEMISPMVSGDKIDKIVQPLVEKVANDKIDEIIIALKLTIEGETTAAYIAKILEKETVRITKIAQGIPHGADIDYVDALTIEKAFEDRK